MLDRQAVTLTRLHLGIDGLAEPGSDMLSFGIGRILNQAPQPTPYLPLGRAVEILTDKGLGDAVTGSLVAVQRKTHVWGHVLAKESPKQVKSLGLPLFDRIAIEDGNESIDVDFFPWQSDD